MGGSSSTQTQQPAPLDQLRGKYAMRLHPDILSAIMNGIYGRSSSQEETGNLNMQQQFRHQMGRMGVQPGGLRTNEFFRKSTEGLTYPKNDFMNAALQMYTGIPGVGGGTSTKTSPGSMDIFRTVMNPGGV
jgi:hypothetical protein